LYVALTRPEQQLIVFAAYPSTVRSQYEGVFMDYVKDASHGFVEVEADRLYRKGNPDFCKKKPKKPYNVYELKTNESQSWAREMRIVGKTSSKLEYDQSDAQQRGNIVHEILSKIGTLDEVEQVRNDFFAEAKLDKELEQQVSDLLHSVLETKEVRPFFDPKYDYKTECDILLGKDFPHPEFFKNKDTVRPDRIVFTGDETWVVDFKTGEKSDKYIDQVNGYKAVLEEMGYDNVKGFLLYISNNGCSVEEV
ncbi:MAG: PD-(D/E)XK nuclease family protein, partial [Bacteroidales bacterium]|nr:PD-(D/E)XK nuclease family protein [Bacteroidales bacterium]